MVARMSAVFLVLSLSAVLMGAPPGTKPHAKKDTKRVVHKPKHKTKKKKRSSRHPKNMAVKAMRMVIGDAEFVDMTLDEFTDWLGRRTGANVVVRWNVLDQHGVERDRSISLKRKNIVVRELLAIVFRRITEKLPAVELAARAEGNTIVISTRKDINAKRITRAYDVQEMLINIPHFRGVQIADIGFGDNGRLRLRKIQENRKRREPNAKVRRLINIITTHIQPHSWKVNGGKGTIRHFKGRLIVHNNLEVHQQLGGVVGKDSGPSIADRG